MTSARQLMGTFQEKRWHNYRSIKGPSFIIIYYIMYLSKRNRFNQSLMGMKFRCQNIFQVYGDCAAPLERTTPNFQVTQIFVILWGNPVKGWFQIYYFGPVIFFIHHHSIFWIIEWLFFKYQWNLINIIQKELCKYVMFQILHNRLLSDPLKNLLSVLFYISAVTSEKNRDLFWFILCTSCYISNSQIKYDNCIFLMDSNSVKFTTEPTGWH